MDPQEEHVLGHFIGSVVNEVVKRRLWSFIRLFGVKWSANGRFLVPKSSFPLSGINCGRLTAAGYCQLVVIVTCDCYDTQFLQYSVSTWHQMSPWHYLDLLCALCQSSVSLQIKICLVSKSLHCSALTLLRPLLLLRG